MIARVLDYFDQHPNAVGYAAGLGVLVLWMVAGGFDAAP